MSPDERAEKLRIVVDDAWTRVGPIWGTSEAEQKIIDAVASAIREAEASARNEALTETQPNGVRLDAIRQSYGWALDVDGNVMALTAGDMGFEDTGIKIDPDHLEASKCAVTRAEAKARAARNEALEEAAARCDAEAKNTVGSHCDGLHEAASICRNLKTKD